MAEALVSKGLATVIKYRQDDDQRSVHYDELRSAETQAAKGLKGVHAKDDIPTHRINDLTVDHSRIKHQYLPSWQRALRTEAVVEFVASGSRFRIYCPKDSCLVTFLLAGISCPRSGRPALNGIPAQEGEPFGDDALAFSKERILQRDVSVKIETTDKAATSVIGWLWTEGNVNLSVALVEEGLASVHFTAEKTEHFRALTEAEGRAKAKRKNIWKDWVEKTEDENKENEDEKEDPAAPADRKVKYESVVVTEVTPELKFYAQHADQGAKLEELMTKLRQEFRAMPPVTGSYNPRRGDLCAAKFSEDNEWYRAKVEKVEKGGNVSILYVDYGNREVSSTPQLQRFFPRKYLRSISVLHKKCLSHMLATVKRKDRHQPSRQRNAPQVYALKALLACSRPRGLTVYLSAPSAGPTCFGVTFCSAGTATVGDTETANEADFPPLQRLVQRFKSSSSLHAAWAKPRWLLTKIRQHPHSTINLN